MHIAPEAVSAGAPDVTVNYSYGYTAGMFENVTGSTTATYYNYDTFGQPVSLSNTITDDFCLHFSAKDFDQDAASYYYGLRYYNSAIGRWPSRDPIGEKGGLNLYGWCLNDGVGRWDFLGMEKMNVDIEFIPRSDFTESEMRKQPKDAAYVSTADEMLQAIKDKIGDEIDADGECGNCISQMSISSHGLGAGILPLGDVSFNPQEMENYKRARADYKNDPQGWQAYQENKSIARMLENMKASRDALYEISKYMCKDSKLYLVVCEAGYGESGEVLRQSLSAVFGPDVKIITYRWQAGYFNGHPAPGLDPFGMSKDSK